MTQQSQSISAPCTGTCPPMSPDVAEAYLYLQDCLARAQERSCNWLATERYERALNELLRHPSRCADPCKLASAAWGNAGKVVRARVAKLEQREEGVPEVADPCNIDVLELEIRDFIQCSRQSRTDQAILLVLLSGGTAADVSTITGLPPKVAPVRISRARKRVLRMWNAVA